MKTYTLFQKYIWLENAIHSVSKLTLEEIN